MKVLLAAAEVAPFAKVGGLADVAGSLPKAIKKLGHDIRVILPLYGSILQDKYHLEDVFNSEMTIKFGDKDVAVSLKQSKLPNSDVPVYFIVNNEYFGSHNEVYPQKTHARFEQERFIVFSLATLELMKKIDFKPDIMHCNDWHTANIPVYLKTKQSDFGFYNDTSVVYSIHNLAYQGKYSPDILDFANFDVEKVFIYESLRINNDVDWMKGGIVYSDQINTVSKKYAEEIQTPEYGEELDDLLRAYKDKLTGILNGIDYTAWNPQTDPTLPANYSLENLEGKKICKTTLQKEFGLEQDPDKPLIGLISRLVDQKGLDLIEAISDNLKNLDMQFIVLGTGEEKYELLFKDLTRISKNIKAEIGFNASLAQRIYAGSDMFLMPSRFEPCGLGQLISLRYGTIPIVRNTGGLADTVADYSSDKQNGNGFVFNNYDSNELLDAVKRAIATYQNKAAWKQLMDTAMHDDLSWDKSAAEYIELYKKAGKKE